MNNNLKTPDHVSTIPDDEWCDAVIESLTVPDMKVGGLQLPGFPSQDIATLTTAAGATEGMLRAGYTLYKRIKESSESLSKPIVTSTKILDFGCGWGRIARFFLKDVQMKNLYGVDVLKELTDSCQSTFASENFLLIKQKGSLPFADAEFDIVFANSVFSHLDPALGKRWIREIHRVLSDDGIAYITIIDEAKYEGMVKCNNEWFDTLKIDHSKTRKMLEKGKMVWQTTNRKGELKGYGLAIMPIQWVENNWNRYFSLLNVVSNYSQTILVLKKV